MADAKPKQPSDELKDTLKTAGEAFTGALDALLDAAKNPHIAKRVAATLSEHPALLLQAFRDADFAGMTDDLAAAAASKLDASQIAPQYDLADVAEALMSHGDNIGDAVRRDLSVWLGLPEEASDEVAWALAQMRSGDRDEAEITLMKAFPDADWSARGRTRPSIHGALL